MKLLSPAAGFLVLAAIAGALIGATRSATSERIAANQAAREAAIINRLLGGIDDPTAATRVCRTSVRGYAGLIELIVLPGKTGHSIDAVRVLSHRETPGIGDFIDTAKSNWITGFAGLAREPTSRSSNRAWQQSLDAVTGATITRRAVINGVAAACANADIANAEQARTYD